MASRIARLSRLVMVKMAARKLWMPSIDSPSPSTSAENRQGISFETLPSIMRPSR